MRQELYDYINNKRLLESKLSVMQQRRDTINKTTSFISDMPKSSSYIQDKEAERLVKIIDYEMLHLLKFIDETIKETNEMFITIHNKINMIDQPYKIILYKRFVEGKTLVEVASELNYSYSDVCRKNGEALNLYDKVKVDMK